MKAKAKIELDVFLDEVEGLADAKAKLKALLAKFKKVAAKSRVTHLELTERLEGDDLSDLVEG